MNWLKLLLQRWLFGDVELRLKDLESHFVTKRDASGKPTETLADVPVSERAKLRKPKGLSWPQHKAWLEATDGGRKMLG